LFTFLQSFFLLRLLFITLFYSRPPLMALNSL